MGCSSTPDEQQLALTYLSTASNAFTEADLEELLSASREKNHSLGLTGMLLYAGGHFIQTLEGPAGAVDDTYASIERDGRHRNLIVALREHVDERLFPDWSMGFELLTEDEAAGLPGFNDYLAQQALPPEKARDLGRAGIFHRVFRDNMR